MSQHFPKPYEPFGGEIILKADFSNYATEDKLDIDQLKILPNNLSSLKK